MELVRLARLKSSVRWFLLLRLLKLLRLIKLWNF